MIVFPCHVCRTDLSAEDAQVGQLVRCPSCYTTLHVPSAAPDPAAALAAMHGIGMQGAPAPGPSTPYNPPHPGGPTFQTPRYPGPGFMPFRPGGRRYGFNCGHCSSRLEANEAMAAQDGQCPTCGNNITIPILDRYGRLIDPKTRQIIKQDPHPVHAYAAAGERAPQIVRGPDGKQAIRCPKCGGVSAISANNCRGCGMPFTMEGTTLEATGASNGACVASLVLGIVGLIPCTFGIASLMALIFGIVGINQLKSNDGRGGRGMAIAGIVLAILGGVILVAVFAH